jgi:hypothetical protein
MKTIFLMLICAIAIISCNENETQTYTPKYIDSKDSVEQTILDSIHKSTSIDYQNKLIKDSLIKSKEYPELIKIMKIAGCDEIVADNIKHHILNIGMTEKMCVMSCGKPDKINTTIGRFSKKEQWVYTNRFYLYFENGLLETIQN